MEMPAATVLGVAWACIFVLMGVVRSHQIRLRILEADRALMTKDLALLLAESDAAHSAGHRT